MMPDAFRFDLIPPGSAVVCALSGGVDSMYLLCRLLEGAERYGWTVHAAHYNHNLRRAAGGDEAFVRAWCRDKGVPITVGSGDVAGESARLGLGVEETARAMRYAFLEQTAWELGGALIATGHHAGDNVETVLMNLIRGCGLRGLTGIPERRGDIVRPMLSISRREIETYLTAHDVLHVEDETNDEPIYTRNRVRRQLIPLLEELNPRAAVHIAAAAVRLREDEAELSRQAVPLAEQGLDIEEGVAIPAQVLADAPRPVALRACAELLRRAGLGVGSVQLEDALALASSEDPSVRLDLPGGHIRREYSLLVFSASEPPQPPPCAEVVQGVTRWGDWQVLCRPAECPAKAYVSPREFYLREGHCLIRTRREGDAVTLGKRPRKTVKKLMIEGRLPAARRALTPVLELDGAAAAVGGFGPDADCLAAPGAPALHIIIKDRKGE